jgi:DNA replication protein DnaC
MTPIERLQNMLNALGLKAVEASLESLLEQAAKKETSYAEFLEELLACEVDARRSRYLRARLQLAHLPFVKTFDQFDFSFQPSIDERQIRELRTLRFVHEASNAIFLGPPGVGKTHLSVALAEAAIQAGFGAYFMTAHDLVEDLGRAYREGRLDRRMRDQHPDPGGVHEGHGPQIEDDQVLGRFGATQLVFGDGGGAQIHLAAQGEHDPVARARIYERSQPCDVVETSA